MSDPYCIPSSLQQNNHRTAWTKRFPFSFDIYIHDAQAVCAQSCYGKCGEPGVLRRPRMTVKRAQESTWVLAPTGVGSAGVWSWPGSSCSPACLLSQVTSCQSRNFQVVLCKWSFPRCVQGEVNTTLLPQLSIYCNCELANLISCVLDGGNKRPYLARMEPTLVYVMCCHVCSFIHSFLQHTFGTPTACTVSCQALGEKRILPAGANSQGSPANSLPGPSVTLAKEAGTS